MPLKLKIIIGSTRPGRSGPIIARWVEQVAHTHDAFAVDLVDLAEVGLPLLDEPNHPAKQQYQHDHTKRWSAIIAEADAFVFVTPEYDYFAPASLVNAIQALAVEWARKPVGVVCYGGVSGGMRSAQVLRQLIGNVGMMPLSQVVPVPFYSNFVEDGELKPNDAMNQGLTKLFGELARWGEALRTMRASL